MKALILSAVLIASTLMAVGTESEKTTAANFNKDLQSVTDVGKTLKGEGDTIPEVSAAIEELDEVMRMLEKKMAELESVAKRMNDLASSLNEQTEAIPLNELESMSNSLQKSTEK